MFQKEEGEIPLSDWFQASLKKSRYYFSPLGLIDFEEKRFKNLTQILKSDSVLISPLTLMKLKAFEEIAYSKEAGEAFQELQAFKSKKPLVMDGFKSHLRPYQQTRCGVAVVLYTHGLSALLADDMGLGKTHQAMGLFAAIKHEKKGARFLVVCPTSVLYHWQEKLEAFLPGVKVFVFHGVKRDLADFDEGGYDVMLTSYGILRNEIEELKKFHFELGHFR